MTTLLVPFSTRCLVLPNIPVLITQRCNYKMTVAPSVTQLQSNCKTKPVAFTMLKRNAITWANLIKKSQTKYEINLTGSLLYESIADKINYNRFFQELEMEDTFFSWFLVTELHVWMLATRIMQEEENGLGLRNAIIEAMWKDVKMRGKILGIVNASLMKGQLELLSEQFNASLVGYDEAALSSDAILANHLWKRFFKCNVVNPVQLERLVEYIRKQVHFLSKVPTTDIFTLSPSIEWQVKL